MKRIRPLPIAVRLMVISFLTLLFGCATLKETKLLAPTWFGLEQIAPSVYVSEEVTDQQHTHLLASIPQARTQIINVYGSAISSPKFYACATRACYESFNGYGNGRAIGGTGILLLPDGFNPEVLSHEWSHVELYVRVGDSGYRGIPMWFHEGLAVVVSNLPRHSDETLREAQSRGFAIPPDVKQYGELQVWSEALEEYHNPDGLNVVYAAAGHEVRGWLKRVGPEGLPELIEAINSGDEFVAAYERLANAAN